MSQIWIGLRLLRRQGLYGLMAVLGLTIGFVVSIFALLYLWAETHYDAHIPDVDRLYLVDATVSLPGRAPTNRGRMPSAMAAALKEAIPDISQTTRIWRQYTSIKLEDRFDFNEITASVDPSMPDLMGLKAITGSTESINDVLRVLITERMAIRLFGSVDVIGKTLNLTGRDFQIGAVIEDWPTESHFDVGIIGHIDAPYNYYRRDKALATDWELSRIYTYVQLREGADLAAVTAQVRDIFARSYAGDLAASEGKNPADLFDIGLRSIADFHLNGRDYPFVIKPTADLVKLRILTAIAFLIVLIACINHVNMSTVRSMERAREVAVRKILGAGRLQLVVQFLLEATMITVAALLFALALVDVTKDAVEQLLAANINLGYMTDPFFLIALSGLVALVILLAGGYPALMASAFRPGKVLSDNARGASGGKRMRTALVVFQFAGSISLVIGAAIIYDQLSYAQNKDLGYNPSNIVHMYGVRRSPENTIRLTRSLIESISGREGIIAVSASGTAPSEDYNEAEFWLEAEDSSAARLMQRAPVDSNFFKVMAVDPIAGRVFSADYGNDVLQSDLKKRVTSNVPVVLNTSAVSALGFDTPESAVGQFLKHSLPVADGRIAEVVGVIPDIQMQSVHTQIRPMVFFLDPSKAYLLMIRIDPTKRDAAMQSLREGWKAVIMQSISSDFLASQLAARYADEERQFKAVGLLAGLGILVAIFGQYGLAAYSAHSRRREIGIRKALGARTVDIIPLFVWQFSKPIFIAMMLAWPLTFFLALQWLEGFHFRITPNPLWFVAAGLGALLVAMATVGGHAFNAARQNPVLALRQD